MSVFRVEFIVTGIQDETYDKDIDAIVDAIKSLGFNVDVGVGTEDQSDDFEIT